MRRAPARPVRACFVRSCCSVAVQEHDLRATPIQSKHFPRTSHCTLHTPHSTLHTCTSSQLISSELFSSHSMSSHMSAKFFLAIFMSSTSQTWCLLQKLAKTTSQYYFVLQSLHKAPPSTTLYYKACTKHFPVLLCTTKFVRTTSQYYFVLQSLHKTRSSTTLYYKACTKHFPVLLCTAKLAQSTSQYYCVLQSLHKLLASTTVTKQPWRSHYNAICRDWVAKHNRTTRNGVETCSSKTGSRHQRRKKTILKHLKTIFKRKFASTKIAKICWQIIVAAWMQPLQYDLRSSAAKDNGITHAAAVPSNLDAAITMRFAASGR